MDSSRDAMPPGSECWVLAQHKAGVPPRIVTTAIDNCTDRVMVAYRIEHAGGRPPRPFIACEMVLLRRSADIKVAHTLA
jgi:hypothetical protein